MSKLGTALAGIYLLISAYLIYTQGLFGESFIALILGMPWSLGFSAIEYGGASGAVLAVMLLAPIALNAYILCWIGKKVSRT